jgi:hypothetical protein
LPPLLLFLLPNLYPEKMKPKWILFAVCLVIFSTCTKDIYGPNACFNENVLPIFVSNCTMSGCHNAKDRKADLDLTTYEGIIKGVKPKHPLLSDVYKVIKGNNPSMPEKPYAKLSARDVSIIKLWIGMGAQNTFNCTNCDTSDYTYSTRVKKIMDTWCVGCHNSSSSGGGYNLATYDGVASSINNNKLLGSIKHSSGYIPMPQSGGQLQQCDMDAVEKWINAGHLNN